MFITSFEAWDFVYLRVSGTITASAASHCPHVGEIGSFGPWGAPPGGNYRVEFEWDAPFGLQTDPSTVGTNAKVRYGWPKVAGDARAKRIAFLAGCSWGTPNGWREEYVTLSGSQSIQYEVNPIAEVSADRTWVLVGEPIQFGAQTSWEMTDQQWVFARGDTLPDPLKNNWRVSWACTGTMDCLFAPPTSGRMYITGKIHGVSVEMPGPIIWVRESIPSTCGAGGSQPPAGAGPFAGPLCPPDPPPAPLEVRIVSVQTDLANNSFTTLDGENEVDLVAEISGPTAGVQVQWELVDAPGGVDSGDPADPNPGLSTTATLTSPEPPLLPSWTGDLRDDSRWASVGEPGQMEEKALSFQVRAYAVDGAGQTVWSDPVTVTQAPVDVLRQEYVDFALPVPPASELVGHTDGDFFTVDDLLAVSDYWRSGHGLGWIEPDLKTGLDNTRRVFGGEIGLSNAYRNPVHNWFHVRQQGYQPGPRSIHQLGGAADMRTGGSRTRFFALTRAGLANGACVEPTKEFAEAATGNPGAYGIKGWRWVHVDWGRSGACPPTWQQWRAWVDANPGGQPSSQRAGRFRNAGLTGALLDSDWHTRYGALLELAESGTLPPGLGPTLAQLLAGELDGSMPVPPQDELGDEEAYPAYIMILVQMVERYRVPQATPLLARWSLGFSNGSRFQSAAAGDEAVGWVAEAWQEEVLRPGATVTFGRMLEYARMEGAPLSDASRRVIREHLLLAAVDERPETRHAFVDASGFSLDPTLLPLVEAIAESDPAQLDGRRYVSADAGPIANALTGVRATTTLEALLASTQGLIPSLCTIGWISDPDACVQLEATLASVALSLGGGHLQDAAEGLQLFLDELDTLHGTPTGGPINDHAYSLLGGNVQHLLETLLASKPTIDVTAALHPVADKSLKHNRGQFEVDYSCTGGTVTLAQLNDVPVDDGQIVDLRLKSKKSNKSGKSEKSKKSGKSRKVERIEGSSFELGVTCTASSGGWSETAKVTPVFAEKSVKSKKG